MTTAQQQQQQQGPQPQYNDSTGRFKTNFNFGHDPLKVLNEAWGIPYITPQLRNAIGNASVKKTKDGGVLFHRSMFHDILWQPMAEGGEFIGMKGRGSLFNQQDAKSIIAIAVAKGWKNDNKGIQVHGTTRQKEMLWLEAQRQGLKVEGFQPRHTSKAYQQWLREQKQPAREPEETQPKIERKQLSHDGAHPAEKTPPTGRTPGTVQKTGVTIDATDIKSRYVKPNGTARGRRPGSQQQDIVDAEWRDVTKETKGATTPKSPSKFSVVKSDTRLLTQDKKPDRGFPALPPPAK